MPSSIYSQLNTALSMEVSWHTPSLSAVTPSSDTYTHLLVNIFNTTHASIAYRKQLPPQRTVGTIGSVWQESTPSKETTGPAQTNTQSETAMKTNSRKWQTVHARPLLEPAGFSQLVLALDL